MTEENNFPGGFVEAVASTPRSKWSAATIAAAVPSSMGKFTFPSPYNTIAWRVTDSSMLSGGQDGVWYVGYSYWPKMNYHIGVSTMLIMVGLDVNRGGDGVNLWQLDKTTDVLTKLGWLFSVGSPWRAFSGEQWYFSLSSRFMLYLWDNSGVFSRMNVDTGTITDVVDVKAKYGNSNARLRQTHSSVDDDHHVGTLYLSTFTQANTIGAWYYKESTNTWRVYAKSGDFDEAHIDKSGRYTILTETVSGVGQNRVFDNTDGSLVETVTASQGAIGHMDTGFGYMAGVNRTQNQPGQVQLRRFPSNAWPTPIVHYSYDWSQNIMNHISHCNAVVGYEPTRQVIVGSNADTSSYQNEITGARLDLLHKQLIIAPVMTDITTGGGGGDYERRPKGCLDVTGQYFLWTTNLRTSRLDAFLVKVPLALLVTRLTETLLSVRVKETTTGTGTGTLLLDPLPGYFRFVDAFGASGFGYYMLLNGTAWERGIGQVSAIGVLDRVRILASSNSGNAINIVSGTSFVQCAIPNEAVHNNGTLTFADGDTTPSVKTGHAFLAANSGATTITNFDDAWRGQHITISSNTNNTTIQHSSAVRLAGGSNFTLSSNRTISLIFNNAVWYELSRSANA